MAISATSTKIDANHNARGTLDNIAEKAAEVANKAGYQVDRALDSAESAARSVAEQGRDAGERISQVGGNIRTAVDKSVRDQPMATLAVAVALGFVVGALWKS